MGADFSGYVTKSNVKCTDGRVILPDAFKDQDKATVPLVWQHGHNDLENVLGHMILENRKDGVYGFGFFNDTENGQMAKEMVKHKDLDSLSIFARRLQETGKVVRHGHIVEVSLCLGGANGEAKIDNVNLMHADGTIENYDDEAIIYTGEELQHEDLEEGEIVGTQVTKTDEPEETTLEHAATATTDAPTDGKTVQDVIDSMTDEQRQVMYLVVGEALDGDNTDEGPTAAHSVSFTDDEAFLAHIDNKIQEGFSTMGNAFEQNGKTLAHAERPRISPAQLKTIFDDGSKYGSLKESFLAHADEYGIEDINLLFPDPQLDNNGITYVSRRMDWVAKVLDGVHKQAFTRVKSLSFDITADEARAKGYVKGNMKKDEVVKLLKRVTGPTTVYKKQKLDRDDIIDITEVDILSTIKAEMRVMLDEEIARAILFGDGREIDDEDKIDEDSIRPIAYDVDMYNTTIQIASTIEPGDLIDEVVIGLNEYKGSGSPIMFTTRALFTKLILSKDTLGRRLYATKTELAAALTVDDIVTVDVMTEYSDLFAVVVDLNDYNVGTDRGGEVNLFDFFDIDYNQQKYLLETRMSGALVKPKSAITFVMDAANVVTPQAPTFVNSTGVVTVPSQTGVTYKNEDTGATLSSGAQNAISVGQTLNIKAYPAQNYGFTHDAEREFSFTRIA